DPATWAERSLLRNRIARVGPILNLARSERFLTIEATTNGARFYLSAMPDRVLVSGAEPMTLGQIKDRGHWIVGCHSNIPTSTGTGWRSSLRVGKRSAQPQPYSLPFSHGVHQGHEAPSPAS